MTNVKSITEFFKRNVMLMALLLFYIPSSYSEADITDSNFEEKVNRLAKDEQANDINADDYIGFKVPSVQLLLLDSSLSGIAIQDVFSDELNGRLQFEIELTTDSFEDQEVKIHPTWYDADGKKVKSNKKWENITLIPRSLKVIDVIAPSSQAKELILHIKP